jgi:hypothetical protein
MIACRQLAQTKVVNAVVGSLSPQVLIAGSRRFWTAAKAKSARRDQKADH